MFAAHCYFKSYLQPNIVNGSLLLVSSFHEFVCYPGALPSKLPFTFQYNAQCGNSTQLLLPNKTLKITEMFPFSPHTHTHTPHVARLTEVTEDARDGIRTVLTFILFRKYNSKCRDTF